MHHLGNSCGALRVLRSRAVRPVTDVADELYALTPAEFTAARDERAREARSAGQRDDATAIKKLARPTSSAWLVNQLSRQAPEQLRRLVEVAGELEEAQRTLAGDRLRELSGQRRQVINDLLPQAADIANRAGQPASAAVLGEVRATLEAALADAAARDAVQSGRLTKPLAYAGLGEVDLTAALSLADSEKLPGSDRALAGAGKPSRAPKPGSSVHAAEPGPAASAAPSAAEKVDAAESEVAAASQAVQAAERQLGGVAEQRQFLRRRIEHLERELSEAKREDAQLARGGQEAERERDAAARELQAAERRLGQARRGAAKRR